MNNTELSTEVVERKQCPKCARQGRDTSQDNLVVYSDGHAVCYSCSYRVNVKGISVNKTSTSKRVTFPVNLLPCTDIAHRNIYEDVLTAYSVKELALLDKNVIIKEEGSPVPSGVVVYPFYVDFNSRELSGLKYRDFYAEVHNNSPKKNTIYAEGSLSLFGLNTVDKRKREIILWEGEVDTLYAAQHDDKRNHLGVPGTKFFKLIQKFNVQLRTFKKIYLAFDNDDAGAELLENALEILPPYLTWIIDYDVIGVKDISEVSPDNLSDAYRQLIRSAYQRNAVPLLTGQGLVDSFRKKREQGKIGKVFPTPYPEVDRLFGGGGLHLSEMCLFTAHTGVGKTTFVTNLVYHWVINGIAKVLWVGTESQADTTLIKFAERHYQRKYSVYDGIPSISDDEVEDMILTLSENMVFYDDLLYEFDKLEDGILTSILSHEIDIVVIDVLNDIDPMFGNPEITTDIMKRLNKLAQGSRIDNINPVSFVLIAHTVKRDGRYAKHITISDIAGGKPVIQKSTMIVALEEQGNDDDYRTLTTIKRSRTFGLEGNNSTRMYYDTDTSDYKIIEDYEESSRGENPRLSNRLRRAIRMAV